ncbi:unnamed protein product [Paramecium octaurelia]|uniref:PSI domain-containing protein n=1 Tax=Paramecium octaurelia TaxID=43137 RepID=A0A8S1S5G6_PAROT|nr:unnamed protein product [Paramecium octaurelia]
MKLLLISNLVLIVYSIDKCLEYRTYSDCILSSDSQCFWNQEYCEFTKNLQLGCSRFLNKMACVKQLSNSLNERARCIFKNACQPVIELSVLTCNDAITKHACLDITNIDQLCYWDPLTYQCMKVAKESYQSDFQDVLYSASVCSRIENYLVIHSSIIWDAISYTPDFVTESEAIYNQDLGLGIEENDLSYEKGQLVNNYVYNVCDEPNQVSYFQWYILNDLQGKQIKNLKISDRKREGCIAIQITDDDDYNLLFSKKKETVGVNKIYCRYQGGIFINNRCFYYDDITILTNPSFLQGNQINCYQLNIKECAVVTENCYPVIKDGQNEQIITCVATQNQLISAQGCLSNVQVYQTYRDCISDPNLTIGIYLDFDISPPACSSKCYVLEQSNCDLTSCNWANQGQGFYGCTPKYGCDHPGLNLNYCKTMAQLCQWDVIENRCYSIKYYQLFNLKCSEANCKYLCGNIKTFGQECIWIDEDLKCLNILNVPELKKFESFPTKYVVNRELCMNQKGKHIYKDFICTIDSSPISCESEDTGNFGKELCLATQKCHWNVQTQACEQAVLKSSCDQMTSVSPDCCTQFNDCIYDVSKASCVSLTSQIFCTTPGISKSACLALSNQNCQWVGSQCVEVFLFREPCSSYRSVTQSVCVLQETQLCRYNNGNCELVESQPDDCSNLLNKLACQASQYSCYFRDRCQTFYSIDQLCEGYFLSQSACLALETPGQQCIWQNNQCKYITERLNCLQTQKINKWGCIGIAAEIKGYLSPQYYCEYNAFLKICETSTNTISGCESNPNVNIHRCSAYSSGQCIYKDLKCMSIDLTHKYWDSQLDTIDCAQASLQICRLVRGKICQKINQTWNSYQDVRCGEIKTSPIPCGGAQDYIRSYDSFVLQEAAGQFNPQVCAQIQGLDLTPCLYDSATQKCIKGSLSSRFSCNALGINKWICMSQTYGQCAFVNYVCVDATLRNEECGNLNKWACLNSSRNCVQQYVKEDEVCRDRRIDLTLTCDVQDYQSCSLIDNCYANQFSCYSISASQVSPTSCNSPQIGKAVCYQSNMYCQFFNSKCQVISKDLCEYSLTMEQCANNVYYNCVFINNKCYTQNKVNKCDIYESTNYKFCRQFPNCKYNFNLLNCVDLTLHKGIQNNLIKYNTIDCSAFLNQFDCLSQWQVICTYTQALGCQSTSDNPSQCPHLMQYSKMMCQKYENCDFQFGYYCVDITQTLSCSQLSNSLCLSDISDSLACYWDGTNCQEVTTQICSDVQSYQTNYSGCSKISNQDTQKCMYQSSTQKCKILKETNNCSDFTTNIECAIRANASCLLANPTAQTTTCSSSSVFNANLNLYGCTQLTGNAYYYDIYNYQCAQLTVANYVNVQGCQYLNKQSCIEITSIILNIYCGWIDNQCQQLIDLTKLNDCTLLNKYACINIENSNLVCQWNVASHTCTSSIQTACYVPASIPTNPVFLYSLSLCSKGGNSNACMANSSNTGCVIFNYTIEVCENMGLNKKACVEQTTGYCKWANNKCSNSQLDNLDCNSDVNKNTCLAINDNLCQWNDSTKTCSTKTLTNCSDATNYNQCMNVPNQFCQFTNQICVQLDKISQACKLGYNKYACKYVEGVTCQFQDLKCTVLFQIDSWQRCSKYASQPLCQSNNCEWQDSKCISLTICNNVTPSIMVDYLPYKLNPCDNYLPQACIQIYNKYGCLSSSLYCQWDDSQGCTSYSTYLSEIQCLETLKVNRNVCDKYAPKFCEFKTDSCSPRITDYYFIKNPYQTLASTEISHQIETQTCDSYFTIQDCILSTAFECYWNGSCIQITNETSLDAQSLNINGCNKFNLQWRDRQCFRFSSIQNFNEFLDKEITSCETKLISKQTCLNITAQPCQYDSTTLTCKKVSSLNQPCSSYSNVNKRTCQLLTRSSCDFNEVVNSCVTAQTVVTDYSGLSKSACLSLSVAAYWDDQCVPVTVFECDQKFQSSSAACVLAETPCIYDDKKQACISQYNINAVFCDTPGVSSETCTQIIREPCIFKLNKCQRIPSSYSCDQAHLVNEMACASLNQACSYDQLTKQCQVVSTSQKCSTLGLSKKACLYNPSCKFNNDLLKCECSLVASPQICSDLSKDNCQKNAKCYFDQNLKICRTKHCEDLNKSECFGKLNNQTCYYTGYSCQSARKCEDIFNYSSSQCENVIFDGVPCIGTNNRCFTYNNYLEYCQNSDCQNNFCSYNEQKICQVKKCSELNNCYQLGNYCQILSNGTCVENQSCQQLDSEICDGLTIRTMDTCSLQKYNIYLNDVLCTSQVCALYGISELCDGNQYGNYACALVDQKCQPCEQIRDACQCNEKIEICLWDDNTCRSFLCKELTQKEQCNAISRCLWSTLNNQCLIHCSKIIDEDECNSRTNECYYDEATNLCETGTFSPPSLSITIEISTTYQMVLLMIPTFFLAVF